MIIQSRHPEALCRQRHGFTPGLCHLCPRKASLARVALKVPRVAQPRFSTPPAWRTLVEDQECEQSHRAVGSDKDTVRSSWADSGEDYIEDVCRTPFSVSDDRVNTSRMSSEAEGLDGLMVQDGGILGKVAEAFGLSPRIQGLLLLNVMTVIMATNWVVVKETEEIMDPFTFSALRFSIAAMALFPFIKSAVQKDEIFKAGLEIGLWTALGYILQAVGLISTDASRASFLSTFTVILVPIFAGVTGKGISKLTWAAGAAAVAGTFLLENGGAKASIGDVYNLMSAGFFALQIFRTEHYCRLLPRSAMMPVLATSVATTAVVGSVLAAGTHPTEVASALHSLLLPTSWMSTFHIPMKELLYTGLLSTDLVLLIEMVALHDVPSTDAAIIYTMEPVLGALLAYFMLGERWGPMGWAGAGLILASSLATQLLGGEPDGSEDAPEQA
ncbi:unnamed protein product [Ostreobium quekettii]|uniref:EamA domain-containing protein n=1 Tax=Ostreobium quekettii TaxID=121088 RepID=A0A8S1JF93_9CHLO|nr:unnamed protein product [Ostreobium quekettii]|eukprot:evm.model.scf_256EXC.6 EVM.evm.TU.scf_256EXC.6   scf_256EXC:34857-36985(+)